MDIQTILKGEEMFDDQKLKTLTGSMAPEEIEELVQHLFVRNQEFFEMWQETVAEKCEIIKEVYK